MRFSVTEEEIHLWDRACKESFYLVSLSMYFEKARNFERGVQ